MITIALQSGSNGNCIYVESGGQKLLFDAGISGIQAERRLAEHGINIRDVDALIISHDHADHTRCAGIYHRKYGLPLYITEKTLDAACARHDLGEVDDVYFFTPGDVLSFEGVHVKTIGTPHDGTEGSAFIIASGNKRLGILTDLGHAFDGLDEIIASLDAVFIESNYDPGMLDRGPYPTFLKQRIKGPEGHLSNSESAELLEAASQRSLKWACLSHLSEQNNEPALALKTHRDILDPALTLYTASRYGASCLLTV